MRTSRIAAITVCALMSAGIGEAHQPHDPLLRVAASPNFAADQTLLAATDYLTVSIGVYLPLKSNNGGQSWSVPRGLPNLAVNAIRYSPGFAEDKTAFLGGKGGFFRSTDAGETWALVPVGNGAEVMDLVVSPSFATDGSVFAIAGGGVYRSSDRGQTFALVSTPPTSAGLTVVALSPNLKGRFTLYVGTGGGEVLKSTDSGKTWATSLAGLGANAVSAVAILSGTTARKVIAGTAGGGVYVSRDGGTSFTAANAGLTDLTVTAIAEGAAGKLWATTDSGIFTSADGAATWVQTPNPPREFSDQTKVHFRDVITTPAQGGGTQALVCMFEGLWRSVDGGNTWTYVDILPTHLIRNMDISSNYKTDGSLFATTYGGGNLFTADGGASWGFRNTGFSNAYPDAAAFSPNFDADHVFFSGTVNGLEQTTDAGSDWRTVPALGVSCYPRAVGVSPNYAQDRTVLIGVSNGLSKNPTYVMYQGKFYLNEGVFRSTDGGLNWIPTPVNGPDVYSLAVSSGFAQDQTAFAGTETKGLYKSTDGGRSWTQVLGVPGDPSVYHLAISPQYPVDHTIFAGTAHSGIYKSTNGGASWAVLPDTTGTTGLSFAVSPNFAQDRTVFVGTFEAGLLRSGDGGATFQSVPLAENFITALAISPNFANDGTIYGATYAGLFLSRDGGNTWAFANAPNRWEDDRSETVLLSSEWTSVVDKGASGTFYSEASGPGASATLVFFGSGLRWISPKGPQGGTAAVTVDGVQAGTVSLAAPAFVEQQTVYQTGALACGPHTVKFSNSAAIGSGQIYLDAVDILRGGCGL